MYMKGFTYGNGIRRGDYVDPEAIKSQDKLIDMGIDWACLIVSVLQDKYNSTDIYFDYKRTASDKDLTSGIKHFHDNNVKVCLKPMINCKDGMWRALIDFPDVTMMGDDVYWGKWFESYTAFMCHYAQIAEDTGCEMLCIGCEMLGTERKESYWRELISKVREIYSGLLVYNTNHGKEENIKWFDALDYIGTSAYYPVAKYPGDSYENMVAEWEKVAIKLENLSEKLQKPILFMEAGCRSALGCAQMPWDFTHKDFPADEEEQANFYDSCLSVFHDKPWFAGVFWWDWSVRIYDDIEVAKKDTGFNVHLKKAEDVLRKWYSK